MQVSYADTIIVHVRTIPVRTCTIIQELMVVDRRAIFLLPETDNDTETS
jgi:hypothetical protein